MSDARAIDVALVQFRADPGDVTGNVARLVEHVATHGRDADLVVAPELATTGYSLELVRDRGVELAETPEGPSLAAFTKVCADTDTTLVVGFLERERDLLYDSVATITPNHEVAVYRKTHLFPAEVASFASGEHLRPVVTPAGVIGPMLCFEHAFPEIATTLALAGAQVLVIPSAVAVGFEYLLSLRSRARAQDNQVFVMAANLTGHGFCGGSLIADPRGDVLATAAAEEVVLRASLDLDSVQRERAQEPALRMRRPELYARSGEGD